jgi:hypothetical protein
VKKKKKKKKKKKYDDQSALNVDNRRETKDDLARRVGNWDA